MNESSPGRLWKRQRVFRARAEEKVLERFYDHWIPVKTAAPSEPRWSVVHNVPGWTE
jgi:hypothetical protein